MKQRKKMDVAERFWAKVDKKQDHECWLWTGSRFVADGYGQFNLGRTEGVVRAHRFAWILTNGPIPMGLCALHSCDVPLCVNPSHIFLGTRAENNADMVAKGRDRKAIGEDAGKAKLTEDDVVAIRMDDRTLQRIADDYGVNNMTIWAIQVGKTWKHVPGPLRVPSQRRRAA